MQIHELKLENKRKKKKRVGRGGKKGTYSGRGMKGQKSRAGRKMEPMVRRDVKRYPKLKGYKFKSFKNVAVLNLNELNKNFNDGDKITPQILIDKKVVRRISGKTPKIKILASGEINKKLNLEGFVFSKSAKEKIEKLGGTITEKEVKSEKNEDKDISIKEEKEKKTKKSTPKKKKDKKEKKNKKS